MSTRPNWSSFVVSTLALTFISASIFALKVSAQHSPTQLESPVKAVSASGDQELMKELFPYSVGEKSVDVASGDLISASTYAFAVQ
ncbi:MAG: hypothetical protein H0U23_08350, partial [Blastocatellia bacterium]|nr:hypothetical protein [Blastocatellia bacterium]